MPTLKDQIADHVQSLHLAVAGLADSLGSFPPDPTIQEDIATAQAEFQVASHGILFGGAALLRAITTKATAGQVPA